MKIPSKKFGGNQFFVVLLRCTIKVVHYYRGQINNKYRNYDRGKQHQFQVCRPEGSGIR